MNDNQSSDSQNFDTISREQKLAKAKARLNRYKKEKKENYNGNSPNQASMLSRSNSGHTDSNSFFFEPLKSENVEIINSKNNNPNSNINTSNDNNTNIPATTIAINTNIKPIMEDFNINTELPKEYNIINDDNITTSEILNGTTVNESKNEELNNIIKQYQYKISKLEKENSDLLKEIHQTNKRNNELNEKIANDQEILTESLEILTEQKAEIMDKYKTLVMNLQEIEKEKVNIVEESTNIKKEMESIKEELLSKNQQLDVQRQNIDTLSKEKWMLQEELKTTKALVNKSIEEALKQDKERIEHEIEQKYKINNEERVLNNNNSNDGNNKSYGNYLLQKNYMEMVKENDELKKTCSIYLDNLHKLDDFLLKFSSTRVNLLSANNSLHRQLPASPYLEENSGVLSPFLNSFIPLTDVMTSSNIKQSYEIFDNIKKRIDYFQKNYNELYKN